ncbi:MAG: hypothetical protein ABIN55_11855 [Aeromicrobium sp.]
MGWLRTTTYFQRTQPRCSFDALTPTGFEEFCFALMVEAGFVNVDWRKGTPKESSPADRGRGIIRWSLMVLAAAVIALGDVV